MTYPGPAMLFCPAHRPERFANALVAADTVIIDLEDGVGGGEKVSARQALIDTPLDPSRVIVRISDVRSPDHAADLDAVRATQYRTVMLAKAESAADVAALSPWEVFALCETPAGILNAAAIAAAPNLVGLMWGAEDLLAGIGGRSSRRPDGQFVDVARHARSVVLLAAKAANRLAIDAVFTDITNLDGLADEADDAAGSGFDFKACIHPTQAPVVRRAFRPTAAEIERAQRIIAAATGTGAVALDGQMIDAPAMRQAEAVLRAAEPR